MAFTFVPVHAAGDGAWSWHLLTDALRARGHDAVVVDLPADDPSADLWTYAETIVDAIGERGDVIVVAHSFGAFTAPLVCARLPVDGLVMLSAMIPRPGEPPADCSLPHTGEVSGHTFRVTFADPRCGPLAYRRF